ncbi:MAG: hypothetical protein ACFE9C_08635 [Candidatus Hodarchaeota archaeon]
MKIQPVNDLLDSNTIKEIIKELCKKVEEYYIFPEITEKISNFLMNNLETGFYNTIKDPVNLERVISNDLIKVSNEYDSYKIFIRDDQLYYERSNLEVPLITKDNKTFFVDETLKLWFEEENKEKILVLERRDYPNVLRIKKKEE